MNVVVGVISPAAIWVMPRAYVDRLRRDFPHHTFIDAWDRDTLRRVLPQADVAFTPFVDADIFPSLTRLRWVQSPAVGVGGLMYPEIRATDVTITTARGFRARSMAEHALGVTIALARRFPAAMRAQVAHHWAQDELEGAVRTLEPSFGRATPTERRLRERDDARQPIDTIRLISGPRNPTE